MYQDGVHKAKARMNEWLGDRIVPGSNCKRKRIEDRVMRKMNKQKNAEGLTFKSDGKRLVSMRLD